MSLGYYFIEFEKGNVPLIGDSTGNRFAAVIFPTLCSKKSSFIIYSLLVDTRSTGLWLPGERSWPPSWSNLEALIDFFPLLCHSVQRNPLQENNVLQTLFRNSLSQLSLVVAGSQASFRRFPPLRWPSCNQIDRDLAFVSTFS